MQPGLGGAEPVALDREFGVDQCLEEQAVEEGERESAGKKLGKRIKEVIAAGSVVEIQPSK